MESKLLDTKKSEISSMEKPSLGSGQIGEKLQQRESLNGVKIKDGANHSQNLWPNTSNEDLEMYNLTTKVKLYLFRKFAKYSRLRYHSGIISAVFTPKPGSWKHDVPYIQTELSDSPPISSVSNDGNQVDTKIEDMDAYLAHLRDLNGDPDIHWYFYQDVESELSPKIHVIFSCKPIDDEIVASYRSFIL